MRSPHYAIVDGIKIYYEAVGQSAINSGKAASVVCIHLVTIDGRIWDDISEVMSSTYDLIIPDLPGHRKSSLWPGWTWKSQNVSIDYYARILMDYSEESA